MNGKQKWLIGGAFALVVVLVAIVFAWISGTDATDTDTAGPSTAVPTTSPSEEGSGASGFGNPTTDLLGRKVLTPNNSAGEVLAQRPSDKRDECPSPTLTESPEGVAIENTWGVQSLLSTSDGPYEVNRRIFTGYGNGYQGAVLAAWNYIAAMKVGGDSIPQMMSAYGLLDDQTRTKLESASGFEEQSAVYKAGVIAPEAFRILSCDTGYVALELATPTLNPSNPTIDTRTWISKSMTMIWSGDDWKVQSGNGSSGRSEAVAQLNGNGWTRWAF
ncbi:hypothetical protein B2J88_41130 [Rhodococcus sp. SRB_17]|nr:hypothetical protein [Rhodococcus sp. SRB_17]